MKNAWLLAAVAIALLAVPITAWAWVNEGVDPFLWPYHPMGNLGTYYDGEDPNTASVIPRPETMKANFQYIQAASGNIYSVGGWGAYTVYWEYNDGVNLYHKWFFDNRQAHFSKYTIGTTPGTGTWEGAYGADDTLIDDSDPNPRNWYYQSVGLCGFNDGQDDRTPDQYGHSVGTSGPAAGAVADMDGDGNLELVWFGGYPRWGNPGDAYDPDTNYWSKIPTPADYQDGNGAQVGSTFYWIYKAGGAYWALNLGDPNSWVDATQIAMPGAIKDYSVGWRSPGGHDVLITRTGVTYNYQDMTDKTVTAFTNNPDIGGTPEMIVWHDWLIVIQDNDVGSGTIWAYNLTQGPNGDWIDTEVAGASPDPGSTATVYMDRAYWTVHGNIGDDAGTLFSISITDALDGLGLWRTLGDVDANDTVDGLDLTAVLTAWQTVPGNELWNPRADLDNNQIIDGLDLTEVISNWGSGSPQTVPEPTSIALLLAACGLIPLRRRR